MNGEKPMAELLKGNLEGHEELVRKVTHTPRSYPKGTSYSPAFEVIANGVGTLYVSGQGTRSPETGEKYVGNDLGEQMRFSMTNLKSVIELSGYSLDDVVKTTLFVTNLEQLAVINELYASFFNSDNLSARSTVMAAGLPGGMSIEIEAIAVKEKKS